VRNGTHVARHQRGPASIRAAWFPSRWSSHPDSNWDQNLRGVPCSSITPRDD
jgi:hypothetical protein